MTDKQILELRKFEEEAIEKYGYYYHCVTADDDSPEEIHTHGLLVGFGHLDLQIVFTPKITQEIAKKTIDEIAGTIISCRCTYTNNIELPNCGNFIGRLVIDEFGRTLLRFVVPDEQGLYPWDEGCDPDYKVQFNEKDQENYKKLVNM